MTHYGANIGVAQFNSFTGNRHNRKQPDAVKERRNRETREFRKKYPL